MRKVAILLAVLIALPLVSVAQEAAKSSITISGSLEFNAIHRENLDFTDDSPDQENFVDTYATLDVKAEMTDNVTALVELANRRHLFDRFGQDGFEFEVKEAWVQLKEFIYPMVTAKLGVQNFAYALRNDGDFFLLNTKETAGLPTEDFFATLYGNAPALFPREDIGNDVGGLKFTFDLVEKQLSADLFWFRALDQGDLSNLTIAGKSWIDVFGGAVRYVFDDEKSHADFNVLNVHTKNSEISTGMGFDFFPPDGGDWWAINPGISYFIPTGAGDLELWAEGAWETGQAEEYAGEDIDLSAFGGRGGAEIVLQDVEWKPVFGASYWWLEGQDFDEDDEITRFISFGKTAETLVLENNYYGTGQLLTWMPNGLKVWRIYAAAQPTECLNVKLQYNDFRVQEVDDDDDSKRLGRELDFTAGYRYSPNVLFTLGVGYVWAGQFIEDEEIGDGDNAFLVDFATVVTF